MQIINTQKIGSEIISGINHAMGAFDLFCDFWRNLSSLKSPTMRAILYKQIYFTGITPLFRVIMMGVLIGIVIITQVNNVVALDASLISKLLVWTIVRELGPLLVAILVIARSCTAMTSELGSMKVKREVDSLKIMGINPFSYLIVPRIVGTSVSMFMLTFYFQISAIAGGLVLSSIFMDSSFIGQLKNMFISLTFFDIGISLVKSAVFGLLISTISCYHGFRVESSITEIPQATIIAVMQSLFYIFVFDGIVAVIFFI